MMWLVPLYISLSIPNFGIDELLDLAVGLFALVLLIVSLLSYRKTGLRRMLLISAAFGLFAVKTLLHHIGLLFLGWSAQTENLVFSVIDLMILATFFLALMVTK
ncbi:MAG: hypothetical protein ACYC7D_16040 [Nitrososphaerales archaeon]